MMQMLEVQQSMVRRKLAGRCGRPFLIVWIGARVLIGCAAEAAAIQVEGLGYLHNGTSTNHPVEFRFSWSEASRDNWLMTLAPAAGVGDHYQIESDGAEVRTLVERRSPGAEPIYYANLLPGPEPVQYTQPLLAAVWMAFSETARSRHGRSGAAVCPFSESGEVRRLQFEVQEETPPKAVRRLVFHDDGLDPVMRRPRKPPFDSGFPKFVFETRSGSGGGPVSLPASARMVEYLPRPGAAAASDVVVRRSCELVVTRAATKDRAVLRMRLPENVPIPVADARLGNYQKAIFYQVTNRWPTLKQLKSTPEYMEWSLNNRDLIQKPRSRIVRITLIAATVIGLVALFSYGILRSRQGEPSKHT